MRACVCVCARLNRLLSLPRLLCLVASTAALVVVAVAVVVVLVVGIVIEYFLPAF